MYFIKPGTKLKHEGRDVYFIKRGTKLNLDVLDAVTPWQGCSKEVEPTF